MSIRALGRQFINRGKPWQPGTAAEPQGHLFKGYALDRPRPSAATMESNRQLMAGGKPSPRAGSQYPRWDPYASAWARTTTQGKLFHDE